ncbi:MAG: hypothetical protein Q7U06_00130, partial [Pseudomonadota bacterium]|nr:hypothetical protein [Pseudomonadota bacterium]
DRPALAWIHPVAPPLTHIPEMGESVLGGAPPVAPGGAAGGSPGNRPNDRPPGPPPLRGLAGAVERLVRTVGTPAQQAALAELRGVEQGVLPHARQAMTLRLAVQADAIALAEALGHARVGAILADKDGLSTRIGEGRAWAAAIDRVARP